MRSRARPGSVRVRFDGDRVFVTALPEWAPQFEMLGSTRRQRSRRSIRCVSQGLHYVWAWIDEGTRRVRARMFAPELGIREDEATGAAAVRLTAELGHDLEIVQGRGSLLYTHVRSPRPAGRGRRARVGGKDDELR